MRKTNLWASNPKNEKTHTHTKQTKRFALWAIVITVLKIPNAHKMGYDPQLRKKHLKHKTNSEHIKKKTTFLSSNTHLSLKPIHPKPTTRLFLRTTPGPSPSSSENRGREASSLVGYAASITVPRSPSSLAARRRKANAEAPSSSLSYTATSTSTWCCICDTTTTAIPNSLSHTHKHTPPHPLPLKKPPPSSSEVLLGADFLPSVFEKTGKERGATFNPTDGDTYIKPCTIYHFMSIQTTNVALWRCLLWFLTLLCCLYGCHCGLNLLCTCLHLLIIHFTICAILVNFSCITLCFWWCCLFSTLWYWKCASCFDNNHSFFILWYWKCAPYFDNSHSFFTQHHHLLMLL